MNIVILADMIPNKKIPLASFFPIDHAIQLHKRGLSVSLFFLNNYSLKTNKSIHLKRFIYMGIPSYSISFPVGRSFHLLTKLSSWIMIRILYKFYLGFSDEPQIIHAHFFEMGQALIGLKSIFHGKTVLTEHSYLFGIRRIYSNKHLKSVYSSFTSLVVVSNFLKDEIMNQINVKSIVIPNYYNEKLFKYSPRELNSIFRIVSVVNLVPIKNIELMIKSFIGFSKIKKSILYIIGDGPLRNKFELFIKSNSIKNIKFLGYKRHSNINQYLKKAHLGMITSKIETFNIFLIEALATGIPVLTTNCGGPSDFVNFKNGLISKTNNSTDIIHSLKTLFDNYNLYRKKFISNEIKRKFSSNVVFKTWIKFYNGLQ